MSNTLKFGNGEWYGKEGAILAYNSENKNYKPLPFTFDRASSATRVNKAGLIETVGADQPRIDYLNNSKGALLLEPSRTNLITYSEDFTQWGKLIDGSGVLPIVTSNFTISPDGTQNADKIVFSRTSSGGSDYTLIKSDYGGADINGTASIYLKAESNVDIEITSDDLNYKTINVTTDWKRFEVSDITSDRLTFGLRGSEPSTLNATVYAWGGQLEEGIYPTSYIPTNGSAVTRAAETCNGSGDVDTFNDSEGVLMAEISAFEYPVTLNNWLTITDGSINNSIGILFESTGKVVARHEIGGVNYSFLTHTIDYTNALKVVFKYKLNDLQLWINGYKVSVLANSPIFPNNTLNSLQLQYGGGGNTFHGNTKQLQYFDTALSDTELEQLTSWDSFRDMAQAQLYTIE